MTTRQFGLNSAICVLLCNFALRMLMAQSDVCQAANGKLTALQLKVERDEASIRSLGFGQKSDDVDAWAKLTEDARSRLMSNTFDTLLASAISGVEAGGSVSPPPANRVISKLRSAGINVAPLNSALRRLASTPGKPTKAKDIIHFLKSLGIAKDNYEVGRSALSNWQSTLEAFSSVIGWFETDSQLGLLAGDLKFTTSAIYENAASRVSETQIDKLTSLSENNLQSLKVLSNQLWNDVGERNSAKSQMTTFCRSKEVLEPAPGPLSRREALRACTDNMMVAHHACGDNPPLMGPEWDAWNRCMDAANSAYDSCVASLPK